MYPHKHFSFNYFLPACSAVLVLVSLFFSIHVHLPSTITGLIPMMTVCTHKHKCLQLSLLLAYHCPDHEDMVVIQKEIQLDLAPKILQFLTWSHTQHTFCLQNCTCRLQITTRALQYHYPHQ